MVPASFPKRCDIQYVGGWWVVWEKEELSIYSGKAVSFP